MAAIEILHQLQSIAKREAEGDTTAHQQLLDGIHTLQNVVATPIEKGYFLRFGLFQLFAMRIAQKYGMIQALAKRKRATASQLAEITGCPADLVGRILRVVILTGYADEEGPSQYSANKATAEGGSKADIGANIICNDLVMRCCSHIASAVDGKDLGNVGHEGSQMTFGKPWFQALTGSKEHSQAFNDFMAGRDGVPKQEWFDIFPMRTHMANLEHKPTEVLLVDVAGGVGSCAQRFKRSMLGMPGRIIVQDQPHVIVDLSADGIETEVYDFFTPQSVRGARFYLFKAIMHDWDDESCSKILSNTAQAMSADSRLLIDDLVLPATNVSLYASFMDMAMLTTQAGRERNLEQWRELIESAGLKIVQIWGMEGAQSGALPVIECVKAA